MKHGVYILGLVELTMEGRKEGPNKQLSLILLGSRLGELGRVDAFI